MAQTATPNIIILDPAAYPDGVIRIRLEGDTADRLQVHLDGTIAAGDGTAEPEDTSPLPEARPELPVEYELSDVVSALETLGLVTVASE